MNLAGSTTFEDMIQTTAGSGSISISGNVATLEVTSAGSGNVAYMLRRFRCAPGEQYTMRCMARRISGSDGSSARLFIDWPAGGNLKNEAEIQSEDWQEYAVSFTIPPSADYDNDFIQFGVGMYTSLGGEFEVAHVRFEVEHTPYGALRSVGHAMFEWSDQGPGATLKLNENFCAFNIKDYEYNATDKAIYITIEKINNTSQRLRPLMLAQMTPDGDAAAVKLVPKVGNYDQTTGKVKIQFLDTDSGVFVDIASIDPIYFSFVALIT